MDIRDATEIVAYLNAAYPREALESETARVWVGEIAELKNAEAAREAAKLIARNDERFPSLAAFRRTYRQQADRLAPKAIEEAPFERAPLDDDVQQWLADRGLRGFDGVLRSVDAAPAVLPGPSRIEARPVWARHLRRVKGGEIGPPTEEEKRDAIEVLRDDWDGTGGWPGVAQALLTEAQRIFEEAAA